GTFALEDAGKDSPHWNEVDRLADIAMECKSDLRLGGIVDAHHCSRCYIQVQEGGIKVDAELPGFAWRNGDTRPRVHTRQGQPHPGNLQRLAASVSDSEAVGDRLAPFYLAELVHPHGRDHACTGGAGNSLSVRNTWHKGREHHCCCAEMETGRHPRHQT